MTRRIKIVEQLVALLESFTRSGTRVVQTGSKHIESNADWVEFKSSWRSTAEFVAANADSIEAVHDVVYRSTPPRVSWPDCDRGHAAGSYIEAALRFAQRLGAPPA